jgi:hypothetical protein
VALGKLEVVERLEVEVAGLADLAERDVVLLRLPLRGPGVGEVRQGGEQLVALGAQVCKLGLELLQLGFQGARPLPRLSELGLVDLPGPRGLLDLTGELVLLCPDRVDPGVELAPALVDADQLIELFCGAAPRQPRAEPIWIAPDLLEVERGALPRLGRRRRRRR